MSNEHESRPTSQSTNTDKTIPNKAKGQEQKRSLHQFITAYRQFYRQIKPILIVLWITIIFVVLIPLLGRLALHHSSSKPSPLSIQPDSEIIFVSQSQPQSQIDKALLKAIGLAKSKAKSHASQELDDWINLLKRKVDPVFLNWYFNYFNRKGMEITAAYRWISGENTARKAAEDFQQEFSRRVLNPSTAQLKIEKIARDTIDTYFSGLSIEIANVRNQFNIPEAEWNSYLEGITYTIPGTDNYQTLGEAAIAGGYVTTKLVLIPAGKLGAGLLAGATEKIATSLGLKLGAKVGATGTATLIGEVLDPLVTVGLILWDTYDYNKTVGNERPLLRDSIFDYFQDMKSDLINDDRNGIMAVINQVEDGIRESISAPNYSRFSTL